MENNTSTPTANGNDTTAANKKIVERSASYPSIPIENAITLVTHIYKNFTAAAAVKREDVAAILEEPGNINREVAAAVQYGLLIREAGDYKITPLFLPIYQPVTPKEKAEALIGAFKSPKLYKELIAKYDNHAIPSETALATVLFRQHEITEKASLQAAQIFIANGKFVGVIDSVGILRTNSPAQPNQAAQTSSEPVQEVFAHESNNSNPEIKILDQPNLQTKILNLPEGSTEEKIVIPLTEKKKAVLIYPSNFNAKDIEVLKGQLDVLALLLT